MTRRRQPPDAITNVYFSLAHGTRARIRLCYHYDRLIMVGIRYRLPGDRLSAERMLNHKGERWNQIVAIVGS